MLKRFFKDSDRLSSPQRVTCLDVGSGQVSCAIADVSHNSGITILGSGHYVSSGYRRGVVENMELLTDAIQNAVCTAEQTSQETVSEVYMNISSALTQSHVRVVEVDVSGHEIEENDLKELVEKAIQGLPDSSQEVIHVIPYHYKIDDSVGIKNPRGMFGDKLSAKVHMVTAPLSPLRNLIACVEKAHLEVIGLISAPFASGLAVLEHDEMELGAILLDIGSHSTGMGIFSKGNLIHTDNLNIGGFHLTHDLAHGLSTSLSHAERLKTLYGSAIATSINDRDNIIVPQSGERVSSGGVRMPKSALVRIIRPRVEELFSLVKQKLDAIGGRALSSYRLVITGGTADLPGIQELSGIIMNRPTRIGRPIHVVGVESLIKNPALSCCVGQLSYIKLLSIEGLRARSSGSRVGTFMESLGSWFKAKM